VRARGLAALLGLATSLLSPSPARAHHVPGHGGSEGVRNINSLGNRGGKVRSRVMLLDELSVQASSVVPGLRNDLSLLGEYAPVPQFSFGAQLPLAILAEEGAPVVVGYGDTRAFVRYTPHADKLVHRTLTFNLAASFPTRTYRTLVDPGKVWSATPSAIFTRTYGGWFWQAIALASVESRPAGVALEASVGGQAGGRLLRDRLALGGGVLVDTRAMNWCVSPSRDIAPCLHGRAGEVGREVGSTRATALATASVTLADRWSLMFGIQLPFSRKRDFDLGLSLGVQAAF
jgi:hypothetical protein